MTNNILYSKYNPTCLDDFKNDIELINIIKTFISINKLNLLFIGNSGTGKTSIINAIVSEYYNNHKNYHDNILIINSLKEQGISYYRTEVKNFCQTASIIPNKKKIIILDDMDIINEQSQQVFRNCMDKYEHNVLFLASCTNIQKVIENIQSRIDIIKIKPPSNDILYDYVKKICNNENIILTDEVMDYLINVCNNSYRILLNYLEKFRLINEPITIEVAYNVCTNIAFIDLKYLTINCINNDRYNAFNIINKLINKGYSVTDILDSYFLYIKQTDLLDENLKYKIIPLLCKYISIFYNIHEDDIELYFFINNLIKLLNNK